MLWLVHCFGWCHIWLGGGNSNMFLFSPRKLGKMIPFWRAYFSDGLVQPPTSHPIWNVEIIWYIPYHPCMVYLPTFGCFQWWNMVNVGKYTNQMMPPPALPSKAIWSWSILASRRNWKKGRPEPSRWNFGEELVEFLFASYIIYLKQS